MAKDVRIPVRVTNEQKELYETAAAIDGVNVSVWFRTLAEERVRQQTNGGLPRSAAAIAAERHEAQPAVAPPPAAFIPGA